MSDDTRLPRAAGHLDPCLLNGTVTQSLLQEVWMDLRSSVQLEACTLVKHLQGTVLPCRCTHRPLY